jgi:hypothetical protein
MERRPLAVGTSLWRYAPGFVGNADNVQRAEVRALVDDDVLVIRFWSRGRNRWEYTTEDVRLWCIRWRLTRALAVADGVAP